MDKELLPITLAIDTLKIDRKFNFEDPLLKQFIVVSKSRHLNLNEEIKRHFSLDQPTSNESVL